MTFLDGSSYIEKYITWPNNIMTRKLHIIKNEKYITVPIAVLLTSSLTGSNAEKNWFFLI